LPMPHASSCALRPHLPHLLPRPPHHRRFPLRSPQPLLPLLRQHQAPQHNAIAYGPLADHFKAQPQPRVRLPQASRSTPSSSPSARKPSTAFSATPTSPASTPPSTRRHHYLPRLPHLHLRHAHRCYIQQPVHRRCRNRQALSKYDKLAADTGVLFSVAAFTTYGGWGRVPQQVRRALLQVRAQGS
jgi:hypothetical protein